ncbi:MAG: large-conductance mechanosensitive channel protein MscL [Clostridia bacterium]
MKQFFKDFKAFATKGNVIDMAVGVVIGGAFGKIVTSLVSDIITPLIGMITGGTSLADKKFVLRAAELAEDGVTVVKPENALTYGSFLQNIIDFLIIAFSIFLVIRIIGSIRRRAEEAKNLLLKKQEEEVASEEPAAPEISPTDQLLTEIRDLLKTKEGGAAAEAQNEL